MFVDLRFPSLYPITMSNDDLKVWRDSDIDKTVLDSKKFAVIGFGSQGKAQALNLRDSGYEPIIGLLPGSKSENIVIEEDFRVTTPAGAVTESDIIAVLAPDHKHQELFEYGLKDISLNNKTFVFAHAMSVHFKLVVQPDSTDFVLVAPHSPGIRMRERFIQGEGVTAFIGKTDKSSPESLHLAAAYAGAVGCGRAGLIETSFEAEAIGDIFGEQAVLCGGLSALLKAGYETLVKAGLPPENAYLECVFQIDLIVDLIKKYGIAGMYDKISVTAAVGGLQAEPLIINDQAKRSMDNLVSEIRSGEFTKRLMADYHAGFTGHDRAKKRIESTRIDTVAERLRNKLEL